MSHIGLMVHKVAFKTVRFLLLLFCLLEYLHGFEGRNGTCVLARTAKGV